MRSGPKKQLDVVIIGGGPAGASAARLLARHGHTVTLLTKEATRHPLAESLPPSCLRLFDRMGVGGAVDRAGFLRSRGNDVSWSGSTLRPERFPERETGLQVRRDLLDDILLECARDAGVRVLSETVVRDVRLDRSEPCISYAGASVAESNEIRAQWLIDATGRSGVVGRHFREYEPGETVALVGVWRRAEGWPELEDNQTVVESYRDGWAWSVPVDRTTRYVTFMVDRAHTDLRRRGALDVMYGNELRKTRHCQELVGGGARDDLWACGASSYGARKYADRRCLLVGDAGSFIDPLTSYGIKKALASAWVAAAAVHTCLLDPAMEEPATSWHDDRERTVYHRLRTQTVSQYRLSAPTNADHPFWSQRAASDPTDLAPDTDLDIDAMRSDPDVQRAFAAIRSAPEIDLEIPTNVRRLHRAQLESERIVMAEHLASEQIPHGIRFVRGVDVLRLAELAPRYRQVPDLFEAYNRQAVEAPFPDLLGTLSVMVAKGLLSSRVTDRSD